MKKTSQIKFFFHGSVDRLIGVNNFVEDIEEFYMED